jgi:teichoic acid transport system ATP-binding protein
MENPAINVDKLCLSYKLIKSISFQKSLISKSSKKKESEFFALKNVSFRVPHDITLGIIGSNGAGKTTLLKTIGGIFKPDSGKIELFDSSVSLLSLGAGFNLSLDGIYNIYLNGTLLGIKKKDLDEKLAEIIAFSDIGDFIYQPVRTYSSGMRSRLAFSIACNIQPDILLLDEVLGVGDESFKKKSSGRLKEMIASNSTVLIVDHNMSTISEYCDHVLWLDKGKVMAFGKTKEVVGEYLEFIHITS